MAIAMFIGVCGAFAQTADFSGSFGNAVIGEGSVYTFPSTAEVWAGFANNNADLYPLSFNDDGNIQFTAAAPNGDAVVKFKLEYKPHPDVDPSYTTEEISISGADEATYNVAIPSQGANTFSSFLLYVVTQDVGVVVKDVVVTADAVDTPADDTSDDGGDDPVASGVSITVSAPVGTSTVRLHSAAFGWDLNHGEGAATDNGDGTWTATTSWTADTEYTWIVDEVQEDLRDDMTAGYCANDDLNDWGGGINRYFRVADGDVTADVAGDCSGTPADDTSDDGGDDPVVSTAYCGTQVTHFNIEAEVASAIDLTISNVDANTVEVSAVSSNDDVLDLLIVGAQTDVAGVSATTITDGKASLTLTWADGAPASTSFEVLWSKASSPGNWMLRQSDLPTINTADACPADDGGDDPVDTSVSFTATLPAGTTTARLHSEALGWDVNHLDGVAVDNGDGTWTATIPAPWAAGTNYKWFVDGAEEDIKDDFLAGYCTDDNINGGDWGANRLYSGSGDVTGQVFGECSGTPATVLGCTDDTANNYNSAANQDDNSCTYDEPVDTTLAVFLGAFAGATVVDDVYTFPSDADAWAGFANENSSLYPLSFPYGATLTFNAAAVDSDVDVRFRFEANPYPNTEPSFNTSAVTVSGAETSYSIEIPSQGDNTFNSYLLF